MTRCISVALALSIGMLSACNLALFMAGEGFPCEGDNNCPAGQRCVEKVCQFTPDVTSGEMDGGAEDRTSSDLGSADMCSDLGSADRGVTDAGRHDLMVADAGHDAGPPAPWDVIAGQANPYKITYDDGFVYWTNLSAAGSVNRRAVAGGATTTIALAEKPCGLVVDDTHVYFITWGGTGSEDDLLRVEKDAVLGSPASLVTSEVFYRGDLASNLVVSGAVYALTQSRSQSSNVHRVGTDGSVVVAKSRSSFPNGLAALSDNLYWIENDQSISYLPTNFGQDDEATALGQIDLDGNVFEVASNTSHIFWSTKATITPGSPGGIVKYALGNLEPGFLVQVDPADDRAEVKAMAADESYVYYTTNRIAGDYTRKLFRVAVDGGAPEFLASADAEGELLGGVALGPDEVYWIARDAGEIRRMAK